MPRGRRPTAIVAIAPTVRGEITVMLLLTSLLTYNTGSGVGATSAAPTSGAMSRRPALPRHEPPVIAPSRASPTDRDGAMTSGSWRGSAGRPLLAPVRGAAPAAPTPEPVLHGSHGGR